uniref:NnrU domain-containing protein n=1 Tax=Setaria italica TaxID=4555 RepID=K3Z6S7_SETIT
MASHLRLHLAAPPPLLLHHRRRLHLPRLPRPPGGRPSLNPALAPLLPLSPPPPLPRPGPTSAAFRLGDQSRGVVGVLAAILATVPRALNVLWIDPGAGVGTKFLDAVASVSDSHAVFGPPGIGKSSSLCRMSVARVSTHQFLSAPKHIMFGHSIPSCIHFTLDCPWSFDNTVDLMLLLVGDAQNLSFVVLDMLILSVFRNNHSSVDNVLGLYTQGAFIFLHFLHSVVMLVLTIIFAVFHSGMASLRESGEKIIGERAYRVLFAGISLPLAVTTIVYFINHRYDGIQLWQVQGITGIHELVWLSSFISFFFLYPSTFNLLEVAAVDKPKLHMWETGIMRITRHPQHAFVSCIDGWPGNLVPCSYTMDWQLGCCRSLRWTDWPPPVWCLEWRQEAGITLW